MDNLGDRVTADVPGPSIRFSPEQLLSLEPQPREFSFKGWVSDHLLKLGVTTFVLIPSAVGVGVAAHHVVEVNQNRDTINDYLRDPSDENFAELSDFGVGVIKDMIDDRHVPQSIGMLHNVGGEFVNGMAYAYGAYMAAGVLAALGVVYARQNPFRRS